jgi:trehalose 6-phosphate synthase/phosphatase
MNGHHSRAQRLLIVSNRLPFTAVQRDGNLTLVPSSGGLVSGLSGYLDSFRQDTSHRKSDVQSYLWLGWPGATVEPDKQAALTEQAVSFNACPVFIAEDQMEEFYHGFCNSTVWPLFHYFPSLTYYNPEYWETYRRVNELYADAVMRVIRPGDVLWIHDYQLMLLPGLIRQRLPNAKIGFFLHIPFPGYELFRLLPRSWGADLLNGLLGADLIGFHTHDYTQYFLRSVTRILGDEHNMGRIMVGDRIVRADTFPMGIDFGKYHDAVDAPEVQGQIDELKRSLPDTKIILSVDRLDYTKGILHRLHGYAAFLEQYPQWRGKVALTLVVIPSRIGVGQYQETKEHIEEMVGRINGRFATLHWVPIRYQYTHLSFEELIALYHATDAALVTPLRDGMNLIAKEYIAASTHTGVLILSEMAGAAKELGEAIIVNPNSREEIAAAIRQALEMPVKEQQRRNEVMQARLRRYDATWWAEDFIRELRSAYEEREHLKARLLGTAVEERLLRDYESARRRLILLDYDGTLMPYAEDPQSVNPTADVLDLLGDLAADPANDLVIISGRDRATLDEWLGHLPIGLVAEHGVWTRTHGEEWTLTQPITNDWKEYIHPILETYAGRLPGAFVEEKEYSLVWHYRAADQELGKVRAQELLDHLLSFSTSIDVQILQGSKVIEVKAGGINKGSTGLFWLGRIDPDFILAIGDDWTDEFLFMVLPTGAYTLRVGLTQSHARYNLRGHEAVLDLLARLTTLSAKLEVGR